MSRRREIIYQFIIMTLIIAGLCFFFFSSRFERDKQDILDKITSIETSQHTILAQNNTLSDRVALIEQIPVAKPINGEKGEKGDAGKNGMDGVTQIVHVYETPPPVVNGKDAPRAIFGKYTTGEQVYRYPDETWWTEFQIIDRENNQ